MFIQFTDWERDIAIAASEARERIDAIRDDLPDDLQRYFVLKFSHQRPAGAARAPRQRHATCAARTT